jgi:FAD binding domain
MRGSLQQVLLDTLPKNDNVRIEFHKQLCNLNDTPKNDGYGEEYKQGIVCLFSDGTEVGPFDLVVGCDGINSSVRRYVESGSIKKKNTKLQTRNNRKNNLSAIYSGIRIRYAVADNGEINSSTLTSKLTQYFGNGAYALHGTYGAGANKNIKESAFIVYLDDQYIGPIQTKTNHPNDTRKTIIAIDDDNEIKNDDENADWSQNNQQQQYEIARTNMIQKLHDCGIPFNDRDVLGRTILNANQFFELGVYFHNPFTRWNRRINGSNNKNNTNNFAVLCGDAAHAFPPFLGQGSNQAIQDAYCLASKIHQYNHDVYSKNNNANMNASDFYLQKYLDEYQRIRFPPTIGIFWKSAFLGYLETGGKNGFYSKSRDAFFKVMGTVGIAQRILIDAATPKIK